MKNKIFLNKRRINVESVLTRVKKHTKKNTMSDKART